MRIYTRDKKPNVYSILILSVVTAAVSAAVTVISSDSGKFLLANIAVLLTAYFAAVLAILIVSLKRQMEYNPYSYNTIYYFGFSLFVTSLIITVGAAAIESLSGDDAFTLSDAARLVLNSARFYMRISSPFLGAFAMGLAVSNIVLILKEGKRFTNVLGIILAAFLAGGEAILFAFDSKLTGRAAVVIDVFCAIFLYFECMLIGSIFADVFAARHVPSFDKDYVVILGCRVRADGSPTPLLAARAKKALEFANMQKESGGKEVSFIASGGKGADEPISEAECIKDYLVSHGVSPDRIILEDKSRDTLENMKFSIGKASPGAKLAYATTNYHVFRSGIAANRAKKHVAEGVGADTKWYFWPNASVREFVGLLTEHRGKQILVLTGLIAVYVALGLAV